MRRKAERGPLPPLSAKGPRWFRGRAGLATPVPNGHLPPEPPPQPGPPRSSGPDSMGSRCTSRDVDAADQARLFHGLEPQVRQKAFQRALPVHLLYLRPTYLLPTEKKKEI
jgi:hypothetical protein